MSRVSMAKISGIAALHAMSEALPETDLKRPPQLQTPTYIQPGPHGRRFQAKQRACFSRLHRHNCEHELVYVTALVRT